MALYSSGTQIADVALTDTFNTWRTRFNSSISDAASTSANNTFTGTLNTFNNTASFKGPVTAPIITANTFSGNGSSLTALNASQISSGTIPDARIQASGVTQHQASITGTGALNSGSITSGFTNIDIGSSIFTGNGSGLTSLNGSNISSGTVSDDRLPASITSDITGTAAIATTVTLVATNATDATHYPVFVDTATGNENPRTDTGLTYNPNSGTLAATDFNATSDITYKEQITPIDNALEIVEQLAGKAFNWKHTGKKSYGVIAQEVEQVLPDVVTTNENGKAVNYNTLIALLIESNKQLNKKIKLLEQKL